MLIRPAELAAIKAGEVDLAFRRWDRPRVKVGTAMRTGIGLVEVTSVEEVSLASLRAEDARRAGAAGLSALRRALSAPTGEEWRPIYRVGLRYAGPDPRERLRETIPDEAEIRAINAWLDRLDRASSAGPWTRQTLRLIDANPGVRAPELATRVGRETQPFKTDVRKLKERGLTESLAIGYRLSPRGEAVLDHGGPPRDRPPRPQGRPLPRSIGAPATRALREEGLGTLEDVAGRSAESLRALHGVGPIAIDRLQDALAEAGLPPLSPPEDAGPTRPAPRR